MTISCPFAPWTHAKGTDHHPSFGITINPEGRSYYKCLSCGLKGSLAAMSTRLGGYRKKDYNKQRRWAEQVEMQAAIARPVPDWEDTVDASTETEDTQAVETYNRLQFPVLSRHPYLRARGIYWPTPYRLGLRWHARQRRILFPVFGGSGTFHGFTGRSVRPARTYSRDNPKVRDFYGLDKRKVLLGLPPDSSLAQSDQDAPATSSHGAATSQRRIIVEGLFDYARLVQAGFPQTRAILGTALTEEKLDILIGEGEPVYFFMDNDLAGWQSLFGTFGPDGNLETDNAWAYQLYQEIAVWTVPYPVPMDGTDPGSLSTWQIRQAISKAWLFTGRAPLTDFDEPTFDNPHPDIKHS